MHLIAHEAQWAKETAGFIRRTALALTLAGAVACVPTAPPAPATVPVAVGTSRPAIAPAILAPSDAAFLDTLQRRTFNFFWETTNPANGLVPDRWPTRTFSSIAAVGFGLTAYPIGVEHGWVTREQAAERVLTTLRFFWRAPQGTAPSGTAGYRGFFYHFLDLAEGTRFRQVELSTIDTTLLLGGALFCQAYFDGPGAPESEIRALADSIYRRVDWTFAQARPPRVSMGWYPESGLHDYDWRGYDEAMLLYVLALASPTHPIDPSAWKAYTADYTWGPFYGYEMVNFAPLFGHQYSHIWIDFRGIQDDYMRRRGIDYFENSRRATLAQKAYAHFNPLRWRDYGGDIWGLSASDGPGDTTFVVDRERRIFSGYMARGAAANQIRDDGTITPTAAGGALPFAPEASIPALRAMRSAYGGVLFDRYGFLDSFNPTLRDNHPWPRDGRVVPGQTWVDIDYLGIDQGAILLMAENMRSGLIWRLMRTSPVIRRGLERAGFTGGWLATPEPAR